MNLFTQPFLLCLDLVQASQPLTHTDIRPPNLLLDSQDHLRLSDFDCVTEIETFANDTAPPWARLLGPDAGREEGSFGLNGARYEQFAIGSILYCMTRGFEPYEDEVFTDDDSTIVVNRLKNMIFPDLGEGDLDRIIERCWKGEFVLLEDLAATTKLLCGAVELPRAASLENGYCLKRQQECQHLVDLGLLVDNSSTEESPRPLAT